MVIEDRQATVIARDLVLKRLVLVALVRVFIKKLETLASYPWLPKAITVTVTVTVNATPLCKGLKGVPMPGIAA